MGIKRYKKSDEPLFLLVFGGLGLYGGNSDIFMFLSDVMDMLDPHRFEVVDPEMTRLARINTR